MSNDDRIPGTRVGYTYADAGRYLVDDMARRAVIAWADKLDPDEIEHRMMLRNDLGSGIGETVVDVLQEMARVHR